MAPASSQNAAAVFDPLRPALIRAAYRMLGSVADAEDVVQDAFLRWLDVDRDAVREPAAFLRRVVTRLCLDRLKSVRREPPPEIVPSALYLLDLALRQEHGRWRVRGARAGSCAIYVMFRIGS